MSYHNQRVLEDIQRIVSEIPLIVTAMGEIKTPIAASLIKSNVYSLDVYSLEIIFPEHHITIAVGKSSELPMVWEQRTKQCVLSISKTNGKYRTAELKSSMMLTLVYDSSRVEGVDKELILAADKLSTIAYRLLNSYKPWTKRRHESEFQLCDDISDENKVDEVDVILLSLKRAMAMPVDLDFKDVFRSRDDQMVYVARNCIVSMIPCATVSIGIPNKVSKYIEIAHNSGVCYARTAPMAAKTFFEKVIHQLFMAI